jgi:hypothetical protein
MNLIPEFLVVQFGLKFQFSPLNIAMLVALGFCLIIVWRWYKRRT